MGSIKCSGWVVKLPRLLENLKCRCFYSWRVFLEFSNEDCSVYHSVYGISQPLPWLQLDLRAGVPRNVPDQCGVEQLAVPSAELWIEQVSYVLVFFPFICFKVPHRSNAIVTCFRPVVQSLCICESHGAPLVILYECVAK